jgi:hypothetical protein
MGVQRQEEAKPPIPEPKGAAEAGPKSKRINTLLISRFHSILWQKNPAKFLIPIDRGGEGVPPITNQYTSQEARKPPKIPPANPLSKNLFSGEQMENQELDNNY